MNEEKVRLKLCMKEFYEEEDEDGDVVYNIHFEVLVRDTRTLKALVGKLEDDGYISISI